MTLSLGLRWDYESPITERNNQMDGPFNLTASSPLQVVDPLQPGLTEKGGITFTGPGNRMPYNRDLNNVQPRVGLAWHPWDKTVIRGGYGLSYFATFTPAPGSGFQISTPYVASPDGNITFSGSTLSNPYPQGILTPTGSKLGLSTFLGQSVSFVNPDRVIPRVHQFSVSVQRELPGRSVLEVSYVGSRSQQLAVSQNLDVVNWAQLQQYGANASPNLTDSVANPFAGLIPATNLNTATTTRQQLLLPYPQFTGLTESNIPVGQLVQLTAGTLGEAVIARFEHAGKLYPREVAERHLVPERAGGHHRDAGQNAKRHGYAEPHRDQRQLGDSDLHQHERGGGRIPARLAGQRHFYARERLPAGRSGGLLVDRDQPGVVRRKRLEVLQYVHAANQRHDEQLHLQRPDLAGGLHPTVLEHGADAEWRVSDHPSTQGAERGHLDVQSSNAARAL